MNYLSFIINNRAICSVLEVPVDDYVYYGQRMCVMAIIRISQYFSQTLCDIAASPRLFCLVLASKISQLRRPRTRKKLPRYITEFYMELLQCCVCWFLPNLRLYT